LNVGNEGVNVNGVKATKRKKSWKRKRCTANRKCSENGEVIGWCTVAHRERGGAREESEEVIILGQGCDFYRASAYCC